MAIKCVVVTSGQPSANPRLVKEVSSLRMNGYYVTVIYCPISPWADKFDQILFGKYSNVNWIQVGYHYKNQKYLYAYARLRQKIWHIFYNYFGDYFDASIKSLVTYSQELLVKAVNVKADLYIGHNLGSLPAIVKASKKYKVKCIFDFEDFHRGESENGSLNYKRVKLIEDKYIPLVDNLTAASPLIKDKYQYIFKHKSIKLINNCFPKNYAVDEVKYSEQLPLKLFWFSQHVGKKRGLEKVLSAMAQLPLGSVSLSLMGSVTTDIKNYFLKIIADSKLEHTQLLFIDPVQEDQITAIASEHHIGLCSEYAHIQNRDICLTNKIFMYLLSGNALMMSDTKGQKQYFQENPNIGRLYIQENVNSLFEVLQFYLNNPSILNIHRNNALQLAKTKYNWDIEQQIFLDNVRKTLVS